MDNIKEKKEYSHLEYAASLFKDVDVYQGTLYSILRFLNYTFLVMFLLAVFSGLKEVLAIEVSNLMWFLCLYFVLLFQL